MALFGLFGRRTADPTSTDGDVRAERRAARRAAAAARAQERATRRAELAARAEVDSFVRYLHAQGGVSCGGEVWEVEERESRQDDARHIAEFYREHLAKHGRGARVASLDELLALVSPDHEGWGVDRRNVQWWIEEYRSTHPSAGRRGYR